MSNNNNHDPFHYYNENNYDKNIKNKIATYIINKTKYPLKFVAYRADARIIFNQSSPEIEPDNTRQIIDNESDIDWIIIGVFLPQSKPPRHIILNDDFHTVFNRYDMPLLTKKIKKYNTYTVKELVESNTFSIEMNCEGPLGERKGY